MEHTSKISMWCFSEHPFIENQSNDTILVTDERPDKVQIQAVKVLLCLHILKTDYSASDPPCTSENNCPFIYKTFMSILFWWWNLSSFSATNIISYLYRSWNIMTICRERGIALPALLEMEWKCVILKNRPAQAISSCKEHWLSDIQSTVL